jgi:hypothetical protein
MKLYFVTGRVNNLNVITRGIENPHVIFTVERAPEPVWTQRLEENIFPISPFGMK